MDNLLGNGVGRQGGPSTGTLTKVWMNDTGRRAKVGGCTFDWTTVPPLSSELTLPDGTVFPIGARILLYGQFISLISALETQTITITGAPTGGTFTITVTRDGVSRTTAALAYNASSAAVAAALNALDNVSGIATVTGSNGGPYTITFNIAENVAQITTTNSFTGGASPNTTIATTQAGSDKHGMYGLYDQTATDGRQNRIRGKCFFIESSVDVNDSNSRYVAGWYGGKVFRARMKLDDSGGTPAPGSMTTAQAEALFPELHMGSTTY